METVIRMKNIRREDLEIIESLTEEDIDPSYWGIEIVRDTKEIWLVVDFCVTFPNGRLSHPEGEDWTRVELLDDLPLSLVNGIFSRS